jgi:hypothetical protein
MRFEVKSHKEQPETKIAQIQNRKGEKWEHKRGPKSNLFIENHTRIYNHGGHHPPSLPHLIGI